jgi:uncharacterized protein YcnI
MRRLPLVLLALGSWAALIGPAKAHVQVNPTVAAPGDSVKFVFLVPNERSESTVAVSLQIPKDVLPFSFDDPPGWRRTLDKASDGSIEVVRWRGRLRRDGFTEFAFLASTPERAGPIAWKSIQTYDDGKETAWIGPPESEEPAAVTNVSADAPRQNAGGEGDSATPAGASGAPAQTSTADSSSGDSNTLPILLGAGGLALGAVALFAALRGRRAR